MVGSRLAHFEIREKLGEGGMGEVWKAEDTRLGRSVAIKVLPEAFVADPDRLARFAREARVLASLSHPNIAGIFEVGEEGPTHYLVMELAEGETLAERLSRGSLPVEEALEIAGRIGDAVAAAHDQGVIHRDLKPGNVMVAPDGSVKVLDFGLAKALAPEIGSGPELALSPTLTFQPTAAGMLLGTAAYMSPEQAKGRPADRRSDVWAWGCVLYEMLTGRSPFAGDSVAEILARTLQNEPDWEALPAGGPPGLERVLRRCLEKDPRRRLRDVGDACLLMVSGGVAEPATLEASLSSRRREWVAWGLAAVVTLAAVGFVWKDREAAFVEPTVTRFDIVLPEDGGLALIDEPILAFSPDGVAIAFVARSEAAGVRTLRVRSLENPEPIALPGT
ncbi:MAG TPA: serine/threonine-protein kinase, partial [Longimicrobiaceae bacterium]|nr:serine/threonine-protein kinase [Longimicrobiaceae bacterium]